MTVDSYTAAAALGVHPRTVRRWVNDGTLTNRGTTSRIRIPMADLHNARTRRQVKRCRLDKLSATL